MAYTGVDSSQRIQTSTAATTTNYTNNTFGIASQAATTGGTTTTTDFTYNPGGQPSNLNSLLIGSSRYYYLYDGTGNVIALIDSSGNRVGTYGYSPYGITTMSGSEATANPFRFQGGYQDSTGYYKYGTRYYNPAVASWTQPDPKAGSINNPTTLLLYDFAGNDPVNNSDPTGLSCSEGGGAGCAIAGALSTAGGAEFVAGGAEAVAVIGIAVGVSLLSSFF
jgi:RHS repeat-associated protein